MSIFVTGVGAISSIGMNAEENLNSIESGRTGIKYSETLNLMVGEIALSNEEIAEKLQLPKGDYSRTTLIGLLAAKEAWGENRNLHDVRTGLISATSVGGLDKMEQYYFQAKKHSLSDNYHLMTHDNGRTTEGIAQALNITGFIDTISTACSSGANAIMHGARLIETGRLDRVIVGGADPLAEVNIKGFNALMIYDNDLCKPFDAARKGLNLGEGAAFLVLENDHSISRTENTPLCVLSGWNNASDAYHQTASSEEGIGSTLTMTKALQKAGISGERIGYINAHGTGTQNNDLSESVALKNVFGTQIPPFSSTKGFTGHTLAAAGALEAVFCVQSICLQAVLPGLNFKTPIRETGLIPEVNFRINQDIEYVLSNSFGFGGNCTTLIFGKA